MKLPLLCILYMTDAGSHDSHVMLTDINIDVVLILRPLLTELHEALLGSQ